MLTTSQALGDAAVVDVRLSDGTQGQACVTGRDDNIGLALLKPLLEPRTYEFAELSSEAPLLGDRLALLQHSASSPHVSKWIITVSGYREGDPGYAYFGIQAGDTPADGATVMNTHAEVQGIRMPSQWLLQHEIGNPGEVWAIDASTIVDTALPILRSGRMHIDFLPLPERGLELGPPSLSLIFRGNLTVDGTPAPVGSLLYARVSKAGVPDYWISEEVVDVGFFAIGIGISYYGYHKATIEFWMECKRSPITATYDWGQSPIGIVDIDLAF